MATIENIPVAMVATKNVKIFLISSPWWHLLPHPHYLLHKMHNCNNNSATIILTTASPMKLNNNIAWYGPICHFVKILLHFYHIIFVSRWPSLWDEGGPSQFGTVRAVVQKHTNLHNNQPKKWLRRIDIDTVVWKQNQIFWRKKHTNKKCIYCLLITN